LFHSGPLHQFPLPALTFLPPPKTNNLLSCRSRRHPVETINQLVIAPQTTHAFTQQPDCKTDQIKLDSPPNAPPIAESPSPRHNDPRLKERPNAYRSNVDPFFPPIGGLSQGLDLRDAMKRMSPHDKLLQIEEKLASWHPLLRNIVIKAARSMIHLSCSFQDKQKVLSK
jgi:hypothetical protein